MGKQPLEGDRAPSSIAFLLSQVGILASQRFAQRIAEAGLHPPQFRVMNMIDAAEGCSQQAIAEAIGAPPSRMVAIVDELEEQGLVERRPHPSDRRVRALHLTAAGRETLAAGRRIAAEHEAELMKGFSAADRRRFASFLRRVVDEQGIGRGVHPGLGGGDGG
ncbi:MAG TPA: MarR family transcriptional regulator [Solirubrobacterales bacterium]|jgi:DNA-binding MarR family transcriptional regulator|nr:MarR family transcriptional regulator [Solirubrobacterales bacterium]